MFSFNFLIIKKKCFLIGVDDIKSGKGTLNLVTQDESFAKTMHSTVIDIKDASEKLNVNIGIFKE